MVGNCCAWCIYRGSTLCGHQRRTDLLALRSWSSIINYCYEFCCQAHAPTHPTPHTKSKRTHVLVSLESLYSTKAMDCSTQRFSSSAHSCLTACLNSFRFWRQWKRSRIHHRASRVRHVGSGLWSWFQWTTIHHGARRDSAITRSITRIC